MSLLNETIMRNIIKDSINHAWNMFTVMCTAKYIDALNGFDGFISIIAICFISLLVGVAIVFIDRIRASKKEEPQ
jgi:ABC-type antimicrobial peptide transport system permease subunit